MGILFWMAGFLFATGILEEKEDCSFWREFLAGSTLLILWPIILGDLLRKHFRILTKERAQ